MRQDGKMFKDGTPTLLVQYADPARPGDLPADGHLSCGQSDGHWRCRSDDELHPVFCRMIHLNFFTT